jgi:hypothetical protein
MPRQEKRAWILLSIILITLAAYFALVSYGGKLDSVSLAVLAVFGFLGFRRNKGRPGEILYDERDLKIERQALLFSLCLFYGLMIVFSVASSFWHGWDTSVSIEIIVQAFWIVSLVIWALKALFTIALYRRSARA